VFVKFEIKQDQFCVWFNSLAQLLTEVAQVSFQSHFLNKDTAFSYFFPLLPHNYRNGTWTVKASDGKLHVTICSNMKEVANILMYM